MTTDQELLDLYRKNAALKEQLNEADVANIRKIVAIEQAVDDLHNIIAQHRPGDTVACAIDAVIDFLEDAVR